MKHISKIGDIFAIPFFLLLMIYLIRKKKRTFVEKMLLFFAIVGFVADILFTFGMF